jgi:Asp-tRNA(Asn)/Glu-tRNA(Gln) amidotransferase A subunit family amidase
MRAEPSSIPNPLTGIGLAEAASRIAAGEMLAEAYAGALLAHQARHSDLNALVSVDPDRTLTEAREVDLRRRRGDPLGPLAGVPLVFKDQMEIAGYGTTAGTGKLRGYVARETASLATRLFAAGAVPFGKANCGDMMGGAPILTHGTTTNPFFGACRNPYDLARCSGGSSGGVGVAVAAGICPGGIGEDTGGSSRLPAACTGTVGLRPSTFTLENALNGRSRKRYPDDGMVPPAGLYETWGPMARTVRDVALLDCIITGEPTKNVALPGVRLGVPRADYWTSGLVDDDVAECLIAATQRLADAGAVLVEYDLLGLMDLTTGCSDRLGNAVRRPYPISAKAWLLEHHPEVTIADIRGYLPSLGLQDTDLELLYVPYDFAEGERERLIAEAARRHRDLFDQLGLQAIALPTMSTIAPLINANGDTPGQHVEVAGKPMNEIMMFVSHTRMAPRLGAPAISLPAGLARGMPVGLELQGLPGRDSDLLGLGIAVEAVLGSLPPPPLRAVEEGPRRLPSTHPEPR